MTILETVFGVADELGVPVLGVGVKHDLLDNHAFPWPKHSLFTPPSVRVDGWPAAWELAKRAGIYAGCGNTGQAQIRSDAGLPAGVWVRALDGWVRVA